MKNFVAIIVKSALLAILLSQFSLVSAQRDIWSSSPDGIYPSNLYARIGVGTTTPATRLHIPHNSDSLLRGTSAFGGIHLEQTGGADRFVGITTDATSYPNTTQGGILFQGSGSYGTKIHFLTTDSYRQGMKQRMMIDHLGNVGIGTTTPSAKLDVHGTARITALKISRGGVTNNWSIYHNASAMADYGLSFQSNENQEKYLVLNNGGNSYFPTGNVGIGTATPSAKLDVEGVIESSSLRIQKEQVADHWRIYHNASSTVDYGLSFYNDEDQKVYLTLNNQSGDGGNSYFPNSGLGVGTIHVPEGFKLAVDGKVICEELQVKLSENWPDYVFADDYNLMSLDQLDTHIRTEKHLPGIPAASEMEESGIAVGEMQRLMMEKIEELTLYILQQQKQISAQQSEIEVLKSNMGK